MIARNYFSIHPVLHYAIEEIAIAHRADSMITQSDFILIAVAPHYPIEQISHFIQTYFKTDQFLAFHAVDTFSGMETVSGIAMCMMQFERKGSIKTLILDDIFDNLSEAIDITVDYLEANRDATHFLFAGSCENRFAYFVDALEKSDLDKAVFSKLVGGVCSGLPNTRTGEVETYQATSNRIIKNGFALVSFCGCDSAMSVSLGFKPVGVSYTVNEASENRVNSIDDNRSFVYTIDKLTRDIPDFEIRHLWYCPIVLLDEKEGYVSVVRTFKEIHKDSIEFFGPIKVGSRFKLSYAEPSNLLEADVKSAERVLDLMPEVDLAFNFSCIARQYTLDTRQHEEALIYSTHLNAPLFGFFTFGEIGPDKKHTGLKFYNETSLLTGIKER